jgi:hypothetical protein
MGINLHPSIIDFFERRMADHSAVVSCERLPRDDEIIYAITRRKYGDKIQVWLADQYRFDYADFLNRPGEIKAGDYILIARPEATGIGSDEDARIGVGKIGELMGALNKREMWKYVPPSEEEARRRKTQL